MINVGGIHVFLLIYFNQSEEFFHVTGGDTEHFSDDGINDTKVQIPKWRHMYLKMYLTFHHVPNVPMYLGTYLRYKNNRSIMLGA